MMGKIDLPGVAATSRSGRGRSARGKGADAGGARPGLKSDSSKLVRVMSSPDTMANFSEFSLDGFELT